MRPTPAALALLLLTAAAAPADGCKYTVTGRKVPEREQRAMIAWADGTETLHVATLADPTAEGTVWIVPARAAATAVRAEPVEEFPAVVYYDTLRRRAEDRLREWPKVTAALNTGGCCCVLFAGGCDDKSAARADEVSRVERLGMVVTVVSADSRAGLANYLAAQGVDHRKADLSSLDPYFGPPGYAFVCGWVARRDEPVQATGIKVAFPSPNLWFPLRPTRAYTDPVQTVVYTRGFVKPADGCDLPGLRCEYVYGIVQNRGLGQTFEVDRWGRPRGIHSEEELTRVTLTTDPQQWDRDLELEPGTTAPGSVALLITGPREMYVGVVGSILLGGLLGLILPPLTVRRDQRQSADYLFGALTGAALIGSLWSALTVFGLWRHLRFEESLKPSRRYVVVLLLAAAHFGLVVLVCWLLRLWIAAGQ